MNVYTIEPQDLLFFRDGRPTATAGGHGARWPEPSVIFDALHAALHRAFPVPQPWEHAHRFGRSSDRDPARSRTQRFGSLATAGVFPIAEDGRWFLPAPADANLNTETHDPEWLLKPMPLAGCSNRPAPFIRYAAANFSAPSKAVKAPWWSTSAWIDYLQSTRPNSLETKSHGDLFDSEWNTGIGMDPETQTQDGSRVYSAEYLRLRPKVRCGFLASLLMKQNGTVNRFETIQNLFTATDTIIVGGQRRPCRIEPSGVPPSALLPRGATVRADSNGGNCRVKWVLLSPAIWPEMPGSPDNGTRRHPGGWLPNWICPDSGRVLLVHRGGERRRVWDDTKGRAVRRSDVESKIEACLVGACVPKPVPITGWTERLHLIDSENHWKAADTDRPHGPRPTLLAVPAGAVYYFEAANPESAIQLANALNWHGTSEGTEIRNRRSTLMGEKGFGLGVCGTWTPFGT